MSLPAPARAISSATTDSVAAARAQDSDAFETATDALAACDPEQVRLVLGRVLRQLLEDTHKDGFGADDLQELLESTVRWSVTWAPRLDADVFVTVLMGALGIHPDDPTPPLPPVAVARHATLLLTHLLGPRPAEPYLSAALAAQEEEELNDVP